MQVTQDWRVWKGRRIINRCPREAKCDTPAIYLALQPFGFHWIMPLIVELQKRQTIEPAHPLGKPWELVFLIDYRGGRNTPATSVNLRVCPRLISGFQISIPLDPKERLRVKDIEYCVRQYVL